MSTQGPSLPAAASTVNNFIGNTWSNPTRIEVDDGSAASCDFSGFSTLSDGLVGSNFGFTIPAGATINGITVSIKRAQLNGGGGSVSDNTVSLRKAGSNAGSNKAAGGTWPGSLTVATYGSASDLWGTTWTPSDINNSGFGLYLDMLGVAGAGVTGDVDYYKITINYTSAVADGTTATVTVSATFSAKLGAVGAESANVTLAAAEAAKLDAVASETNNVALSVLETGVKTSFGIQGGATFDAVFGSQQSTSGGTAANVTLGVASSGGLSEQGSIAAGVLLAAYQTAKVAHAPLPCSDITDYLNLITSQHNQRAKYMAVVSLLVQAMRDAQCLLKKFTSLFDVSKAQGDQLDICGLWIGAPRSIAIPLQNTVFFSWNTTGLGWGQGNWFGAGDTLTGYVTLSDDQYRTLLMARIASNMWDGTVPGAYAIWQLVLALEDFQLLIQDNQDMSISIIFLSNTVDAITQALLVNGYLTFRPAGVRIAGYFKAVPPVFGWGPQNSIIGGWGTGSWITTTQIG